MLLEALRIRDFELVKILTRTYMKAIERDDKFIEYIDRIAKYHFG